MRGLTLRAQVYLCVVALAAATAAALALRAPTGGWPEASLMLGLAVSASLAQSFELRTSRKAYVTTLAFLLAAALMVGPLACAVVATLPFAVEQLRKPKTVYIQVFNASSHVLSTLGAWATFRWVVDAPAGVSGDPAAVAGAALAVLVFLLSNHVLLAIVLWWARGVTPRESELFSFEGLVTDLGLLALGVVIASLWSLHPALVAFALVPFALLQRALYFPELRRATRTDPKTGLLNATYFTEVAADEIRRAVRTAQPLCVLVADLDLLRNINNAYGHLAGDVILKGVATILGEEVREYDVVARFGGEEFAVLLPAADATEGRQVAERIRGRVAREAFDVKTSVDPIRTTISVGLAVLGEHGKTIEELVHAADLAVYRAKVEGRDRVCIANADDDLATAPLVATRPPSPVVRLLAPGRDDDVVAAAVSGDSTSPPPAAVDLVPGATAAPGALNARPEPTGHRPRPAPERRAARRTWPLTAATVVVAALFAAVAARAGGKVEVATVVVFALLALVAEMSGENIYASSFVSLSAVPILAALAAGRPVAALAAAATSGIAGALASRARPEQSIFNLANFLLSTSVAGLVRLRWDLGDLLPGDLPVLMPVMLATTAVYFLVDNGLVSLVVALDEGREPLRVFREDFAWLAPHFATFGALGTLLGVSWETFEGWGVVAFLLPPLLARVAQRQYLAKTTSNVADLRRLNGDLEASRDALERSNVALEKALVAVRERHLATARALAGAIDARDKTTGGHIERVSALGQAMCELVDPMLASDPQVAFGFLLHDVGKIGVPDAVLLKAGPLTGAERTVIERHPEIGEALLADAGFTAVAREIVLTHHERWDGTGYPRGLAGTQIPLGSRLFAVADSIDAMTNDRPYRRGMPLEQAFEELRRHSGTQFDPQAVEALLTLGPDRVAEFLQLGRTRVARRRLG